MEVTMETTDERMAMFSPQQIAQIERNDAEVRKKMSPRGVLGLSPHLDARRLEFGITDGAFRVQAAFDRILVHQIPMMHFAGGKFGEDSMIHLPDSAKRAREFSAPRGVVISAGLKALDEMRSNGIELGDIISFLHVSPWAIEVDMIGGKAMKVLVMHAGNIIGCEDTTARLRKRELFVDGPVTAHIYVNRGTGERPEPVLPAMMNSEEY
jgi:hypothetical protein